MLQAGHVEDSLTTLAPRAVSSKKAKSIKSNTRPTIVFASLAKKAEAKPDNNVIESQQLLDTSLVDSARLATIAFEIDSICSDWGLAKYPMLQAAFQNSENGCVSFFLHCIQCL